jgi:transcriptional regulator with XRE-family HTH domain
MEKNTQRFHSKLFRERLVFAMQERGVNNSQVATATGLTRSIISEYVNGNKLPRFNNVNKIANFLGVNRFWLLGDLKVEAGYRSQPNVDKIDFFQNKRSLIALMIYEYSRSKKSYCEQYDELIRILSVLNKEGLDRMISLGNDLSTIEKYNLKQPGSSDQSSDKSSLGQVEGDKLEFDKYNLSEIGGAILSYDEQEQEFFRYQKINFLLGDYDQMLINQEEMRHLLRHKFKQLIEERK